MEHIYKKLHANRYEHVELARRARDYQAELYEITVMMAEACHKLNEMEESTDAPLPETE